MERRRRRSEAGGYIKRMSQPKKKYNRYPTIMIGRYSRIRNEVVVAADGDGDGNGGGFRVFVGVRWQSGRVGGGPVMSRTRFGKFAFQM